MKDREVFYKLLIILALLFILPVSKRYFFQIKLNFKENEPELNRAGYWEIGPIEIDDNDPSKNWLITAATYDWCSGNGTWNNPFMIENVTINGASSSSCIEIRDSIVYFKIENCTLYNSNSGLDNGGIELKNVINGHLINNNCSNNKGNGIYLTQSDNNIIKDNILSHNEEFGILLEASDVNFVSGNTMASNSNGIYLGLSNDNIISANTAIDNDWRGIYLSSSSNNNNISNNNVNYNNDDGIMISSSNNNKVIGNTVDQNSWSGICIWSSDNNIISGNMITNNEFGIYFYESKCNELLNNTFSGNGEDIHGTQGVCPDDLPPDDLSPVVYFLVIIVVLTVIAIGSLVSYLVITKKIGPARKRAKYIIKEKETVVSAAKIIEKRVEPAKDLTKKPSIIKPKLVADTEVQETFKPEIEKPVKIPYTQCPFCGIEVDEKQNICRQCGKKLKK